MSQEAFVMCGNRLNVADCGGEGGNGKIRRCRVMVRVRVGGQREHDEQKHHQINTMDQV